MKKQFLALVDRRSKEMYGGTIITVTAVNAVPKETPFFPLSQTHSCVLSFMSVSFHCRSWHTTGFSTRALLIMAGQDPHLPGNKTKTQKSSDLAILPGNQVVL